VRKTFQRPGIRPSHAEPYSGAYTTLPNPLAAGRGRERKELAAPSPKTPSRLSAFRASLLLSVAESFSEMLAPASRDDERKIK